MDLFRYKELMEELEHYSKMQEVPPITAPMEADPQYKLVVKLSELATEIEQEICVIHKFSKDKYEKRFPELDSLVPLPLDYIHTVRTFGHSCDSNRAQI